MQRCLLGLLLLFPLLTACDEQAAAPAPGVLPRSDWRQVDPDPAVLAKYPMGKVRHISIHHTETPEPDTVSEEQRLRSIQNYHQAERGWGDIAYHYLIGPGGTVYAGRSEKYASSSGTFYLKKAQWEAAGQDEFGRTRAPKPEGVLRPGHSAGHLTISLIGNYGEKLPSEASRKALAAFVASKLKEHGLTSEAIYFHREIACWTDCPGQTLYDWFRGPTRQRGAKGEGLKQIEAALAQP